MYAVYRNTSFMQSDLDSNTILLDRDGLTKFYGPSMSDLGMLCVSRSCSLIGYQLTIFIQ